MRPVSQSHRRSHSLDSHSSRNCSQVAAKFVPFSAAWGAESGDTSGALGARLGRLNRSGWLVIGHCALSSRNPSRSISRSPGSHSSLSTTKLQHPTPSRHAPRMMRAVWQLSTLGGAALPCISLRAQVWQQMRWRIMVCILSLCSWTAQTVSWLLRRLRLCALCF